MTSATATIVAPRDEWKVFQFEGREKVETGSARVTDGFGTNVRRAFTCDCAGRAMMGEAGESSRGLIKAD